MNILKEKIGNWFKLFFTILIGGTAGYLIGSGIVEETKWWIIVMATLLIFYIWDNSAFRQIHE